MYKSLITSEEIFGIDELPLQVLDFTDEDLASVKHHFTDQAFMCLWQAGIGNYYNRYKNACQNHYKQTLAIYKCYSYIHNNGIFFSEK